MDSPIASLCAVIIIETLAFASNAAAQPWWTAATPEGLPERSVASNLPDHGDPAGIRKWLSDCGVIYGIEYTSDVLANVHGGLRTGEIFQGKVQPIVTIDFEKLAGLNGLTFSANFFQIHNTGRLQRDYVGGINTTAAIEALPTTRLSEIWLEQRFADNKASIRAGQLATDTEFFYSFMSSIVFLQSDWPTIVAANLPSGGAAYPLSTPGVRFKFEPDRDHAFLFAVLNGNPAGPGPGEAQVRNRFGLNFRTQDPPFLIGEAQFRRNHGDGDNGLATTLKIGAWGHLGKFDDQRFAANGMLIADPTGPGVPRKLSSNAGIYAVIDQQLYRPTDGDALSGVTAFSRIALSPSDRNLIDAYIDGGIVFAGMIRQRPEDRFGVSVIYSRFSESVRAFDRDVNLFSATPVPIRDFEANLELTYQSQIVPGWTVQPDLQFIWHPSGNAARNAIVVGARSLVRY